MIVTKVLMFVFPVLITKIWGNYNHPYPDIPTSSLNLYSGWPHAKALSQDILKVLPTASSIRIIHPFLALTNT